MRFKSVSIEKVFKIKITSSEAIDHEAAHRIQIKLVSNAGYIIVALQIAVRIGGNLLLRVLKL